MRGRILLILIGCLIMAACGPRYSVYNGGLVPYERDISEIDLQPTEAIAAFSTSYAPPTADITYAGPTNRVRVTVPADPDVDSVTVSASGGVVRLRQAVPVRGSAGPSALAGQLGSAPALALADPSRPESLAQGQLGILVSNWQGALGDVDRRIQHREQDSAGIETSGDSRNIKGHATYAGLLGMDSAHSVRHPVGISGAAAAETLQTPGRYQATATGRAYTGPSALFQHAYETVPRLEAYSEAALDAGATDHPLPLLTLESAAVRRGTATGAMGVEADVPLGYAETDTGKLLAHRESPVYVQGSDARISALTSDASVRRAQMSLVGRLEEGLTVEVSSGSRTVSGKSVAGNVLAASEAEAAAFMRDPRGLIRALTIDAAESRTSTRSLQYGSDVLVSQAISAVSPPGLSVFLVGRLLSPRDTTRLIDRGVLEGEPEGRFLIQYRFYVFNYSMSLAQDVRIINRLDDYTPFFAPAAAQADSIDYDPTKHTVIASMDGLASMEGAMFEFYVEAP